MCVCVCGVCVFVCVNALVVQWMKVESGGSGDLCVCVCVVFVCVYLDDMHVPHSYPIHAVILPSQA